MLRAVVRDTSRPPSPPLVTVLPEGVEAPSQKDSAPSRSEPSAAVAAPAVDVQLAALDALQIVPWSRSRPYFLMLPAHACWPSRGLKSVR